MFKICETFVRCKITILAVLNPNAIQIEHNMTSKPFEFFIEINNYTCVG